MHKDTYLFIRGRLFICVVMITFISHIICTRAHDAETDHVIDSEPNWRQWMPGRRGWLMRFNATALSLIFILMVSMT